VEHPQAAAVARGALAFAPLDGDARVVSDLLAAAGQTSEECGLAAVGNPHQRDTQGPGFDESVHVGAVREPEAIRLRRRSPSASMLRWRWPVRAPAAHAPPRLRRGARR